MAEALTYADQTVGPNGRSMDFEQRLEDMLRRHGPDSPSAAAYQRRARTPHPPVPARVIPRGGPLGNSMTIAELHASDTGGTGPTVVFLHGNPTSSYLWRHVIPPLVGRMRCVTVDLIGMGHSPKPPITYDWDDHRRHLAPVLDRLGAPLWLVGHDWGASLAIEYARTRPHRVAGVAVAEGHLRPFASWDDFDESGRDLFRQLRDPVEGRRLVEDENLFLSMVLPGGMLRRLTPEEQQAYEDPYPTPATRHPVWRWVTQIPVGGEPAETHRVLAANWKWLTTTQVPRLLLTARPGAILGPKHVEEIRRAAPGLRIRDVGDGLHFLPEDQPVAIAAELADWIAISSR